MSVNGNYVYQIEIDTMEDAKNLVSIATKLKGKIVFDTRNCCDLPQAYRL